jgi:hypothetical protein
MISKYEKIKPPFVVHFGSMDNAHARMYFEWFLEQIPTRIDILCSYIHLENSFADWSPDFQPQSLKNLGKWFCEHVKTRSRTEQEMTRLSSNSPGWFIKYFEIPTEDLSFETYSFAIDIGMYFGCTIEKNIPGLVWKPVLSQKKNIHFQQPVIVGKGKAQLNPVSIVTTYAYGISQGISGQDRLYELYEIWASLLSGGEL